MFLDLLSQLFKIPRKNEDCERVTSSENEILGGCAASPDTFPATAVCILSEPIPTMLKPAPCIGIIHRGKSIRNGLFESVRRTSLGRPQEFFDF